MKSRTICFVIGICSELFFATNLYAQSKNVTVNVPGTLADCIKSSEAYRITSLIVKGKLNSSDCLFLREMAGRDCNGEPTRGQLRQLSLRGVTFVEGGTPFYGKQATTDNPNLIPAYLFFDCPITRLILPATADSIGDFALSGTALRHISMPPHCQPGANLFQDCALLEDVKMPRFLKEYLPNEMFKGCTNLKKLTFENIDYISSNAFSNLPTLQELTFQGYVGHNDGESINECPQLASIRFQGPIFSTGGPVLVRHCPQLESVTFLSALLDACFSAPEQCPRLSGFSFRGPVVESEHPEDVPQASPDYYTRWNGWDSTFILADKWIERSLNERPFIKNVALFSSRAVLKAALILKKYNEALRHLGWLVDNDMYYVDELEADTTLNPLRDSPEYKQIANRAKTNPKQPDSSNPEIIFEETDNAEPKKDDIANPEQQKLKKD